MACCHRWKPEQILNAYYTQNWNNLLGNLYVLVPLFSSKASSAYLVESSNCRWRYKTQRKTLKFLWRWNTFKKLKNAESKDRVSKANNYNSPMTQFWLQVITTCCMLIAVVVAIITEPVYKTSSATYIHPIVTKGNFRENDSLWSFLKTDRTRRLLVRAHNWTYHKTDFEEINSHTVSVIVLHGETLCSHHTCLSLLYVVILPIRSSNWWRFWNQRWHRV